MDVDTPMVGDTRMKHNGDNVNGDNITSGTVLDMDEDMGTNHSIAESTNYGLDDSTLTVPNTIDEVLLVTVQLVIFMMALPSPRNVRI